VAGEASDRHTPRVHGTTPAGGDHAEPDTSAPISADGVGPDTRSGRPTVVAIVLAAGAGTRFVGPGHKLTARIGDRSIVEHAVATAVAADIGPVVVVTGAVDVPLPDLADRVIVTHNPNWATGQSSSLAAGIVVADRLGAGAVVVGLADQPFVTADAWRRVAAGDAPITVATYDGARRQPVRLDRAVWPLLPSDGDVGARDLIRLRPDLVGEVPCPGSAVDIDTLEDLRTWQSRSSTNSP
jgi:CTP:molybdopterin cytidylyltransferase MocA